MEKTAKQEFLELAKALGVLAGTAGAVYRDKKIDLSDAQHVVPLAMQFNTLQEGFVGLDKAKDLLDGMEKQDLVDIITALWDAADKYEQERKG